MSIRKTRDELSPALQQLAFLGMQSRPVMEKLGLIVTEMGKRAFTTPALRPVPWQPRKTGGKHGLLLKTGTLRRSLRMLAATRNTVTIGSDRPYAAIHQFGGIIKPKNKKSLHWPGARHPVKSARMPARPFFPLTERRELTPLAQQRVSEALQAMISQALRRR